MIDTHIVSSLCGCDLDKDYLHLVVVSAECPTGHYLPVGNTPLGIELACNFLEEQGVFGVIMEATARYWYAFAAMLEQHGMPFWVFNPARTKPLRGHKRDPWDARWLVDTFRVNNPNIKPSQLLVPAQQELRRLVRLQADWAKERTRMKNRLRSVLSHYHLNDSEVFPDLSTQASQFIIESFAQGRNPLSPLQDPSTPKLSPQTLKAIQRRQDRIAVLYVQVLALNEGARIEMLLLVQQLQQFMAHEALLQDKIDYLLTRLTATPEVDLLRTLPGVGKKLASSVIAELGSATKFLSGKKVGKFAGLNPSHASSNKTNKNPHITKAGSSYLRRTAYLSAEKFLQSRKYREETWLDKFYDRLYIKHGKTKEGKKIAFTALARKLLVVMWAMLRDQQAFQPH